MFDEAWSLFYLHFFKIKNPDDWSEELQELMPRDTPSDKEVCAAIRSIVQDKEGPAKPKLKDIVRVIRDTRTARRERGKAPVPENEIADCDYCVKGIMSFNRFWKYDEPPDHTCRCFCPRGTNLWIREINAAPEKNKRLLTAEGRSMYKFALEVRKHIDGRPEGMVMKEPEPEPDPEFVFPDPHPPMPPGMFIDVEEKLPPRE